MIQWTVTPDREPLQRELRTWLEAVEKREAKPVFVLSGPPGVGKSQLVQHLAERLNERATAKMRDCPDCAGSGLRAKQLVGPGGQTRKAYGPCGCLRALRPAIVGMHTTHGKGGQLGLVDLFALSTSADGRREQRDLLDRVHTCKLLLIDDFGSERAAPPTFEPGMIAMLDQRADRHTFITMNPTAEAFAKRYDPRLVDRVLGEQVSVYFRLEGESWRHRGRIAT